MQLEIRNFNDFLKAKSESGMGIIEIMFSVILISITAGAIMSHSLMSLKISKHLELNHAAHSLALSKVELLHAQNTSDLDSSDNETETGLTTAGVTFTFSRTTTITVNSDNSRTVTINVATENSPVPASSTYSVSWAIWE
jgi:Tfp pilus assembly protein PilV